MRKDLSRRKFIYNAGLVGLGIPLLSAYSNCSNEQSNKTKMGNSKDGKFGIALVGLGSYAAGQLAPALQQTEHCYLAAIVTGTPSKIPVWQEKYNIPEKNIYTYDNYDSIKNNPDIDIIYVVLPNSMHAEYTIRAAQAGKHVICEKPMAISVADCDRMIGACKKANRMLSIGYRLHFDPYNLEMARLGTEKKYGEIIKMKAGFGFRLGNPSQWRVKKDLSGGGPLQDVGIYCIQGICYTTGKEPVAVTAIEGPKTDKEKFSEVEESLSWQFEMSDGRICEGKASYSEGLNYLRAEAEQGDFGLSPAFNYSGLSGTTPAGKMVFPQVNQQARQMDAFALAVKNKTSTIVPGEMGKRDVRYIQAIYEAMRTGKRVEIKNKE